MKSVYSAVRTGSLNKAVCASSLKGEIGTVWVINFKRKRTYFHWHAINLKLAAFVFYLRLYIDFDFNAAAIICDYAIIQFVNPTLFAGTWWTTQHSLLCHSRMERQSGSTACTRNRFPASRWWAVLWCCSSRQSHSSSCYPGDCLRHFLPQESTLIETQRVVLHKCSKDVQLRLHFYSKTNQNSYGHETFINWR